MNIDYIHRFYESLSADKLSFIYQGDFSDSITEKIISLSEYNMDNDGGIGKFKNKVSFMIVECFQNIVRHGNETKPSNRTTSFPGLFLTRNGDNDDFYITSANLIDNSNIEALKAKLDKINSLDKEQIKALYLEVLSSQEMSGKGGAGLGLIEMARKSGQPLEFNFEKFNDKSSFFYLMVKMRGKDAAWGSDRKHISLSDGIELHNTMRKESILMIYKGDFSHGTIMPMLKMIEENMDKQMEKLLVKKKVYLILVEALQNICRHGKEHNGIRDAIFMIGRNGPKYVISTGNFIDSGNAALLKAKLDRVNSLNKEELSTLYKKELKEGRSSETGAGLGIIDMARESSEKLLFDIKELDKGSSFYSLNIRV